MAKAANKKASKKGSSEEGSSAVLGSLSKETRSAIWGILSFLVVLFLLLAAFGKSGPVGAATYQGLTYLFGIGYYLVPLVFFLLSVSFFRSHEKNFSWVQGIGALLFFVSSLGVVNLGSGEGGVIGDFISGPLVALFDTTVSGLVLGGLIIIALVITFDTAIRLDIARLVRYIVGVFKKPAPEETEGLLPIENAAVMKAEAVIAPGPLDIAPPLSRREEKRRSSDEEGFLPAITKRFGKAWTPPPLDLLEKDRGKPGVGDIKANANQIKRTLANFGIIVEMDEISIGPSVTRYALKPAEGVKLSKILGLQNNLELALAAHPVRIEAPIPGKSLVGIEVPNTTKATIGLGSLLSEHEYTESEKPLLVALGRDVAGESHFANVAKMPHALIAGATGSGKSVTIHAIVNSLLFRNPPENLKFLMIDPKRVELTLYNKIPHLLTPVITDAKKAILALKWAAKEMDRRYDILEKASVRDIDSYHKSKESDPMPFIVIIIDELADLMQAYPRELEASIIRLAQMSRAVGIHLLLSTQRPSVNVITGLIKANVPTRVALQVASQIDSRTILDAAGAEKLLGQGDMLFQGGEMAKPERIQSAYISEAEVKRVVKYLVDTYADELNEEINFSTENTSNAIFSASLEDSASDDDELYEEARQIVLEAGKASTSYLQRKLKVGYARAARLIDLLEEKGVVGPGSGAKPREVMGSTASVASDFGVEPNEL